MKAYITSKLRKLSKSWIFWLCLVTGFAILIRSLPAWMNPAWGGDFGIYYGLTNSFIESKSFFNPYYGWGQSYQYFPVLYIITGIAHWITGIDVLVMMPKLIPIFGGLSIAIFYFVAYELLRNRRNALIAASFLAVLPFHVLQTSHAAPLTLGHFFMMLSMYFFIKYRQNVKYIIPLIISTIILISSHHLTTYMYIISLIFIVFLENVSSKSWAKTLKKDMFCIFSTSAITFAYWRYVAPSVYYEFMKDGLNLGNIGAGFTILLFYLMIILMFFVIVVKRRLNIFVKKKEFSIRASKIHLFATIGFFIFLMIIFSIFDAPMLKHKFSPISVIYAIPMILMFGFTVVGFVELRFLKNGNFVKGWIIGLSVSFLFALLTSSAFEHFRHLEYMMVPISIIAVLGLKRIFRDHHLGLVKEQNFKFRNYKITSRKKMIYAGFIALLVCANATTVYPAHTAMNMGYKVITEENLCAADWIGKNIECNNTVVASDHRIERIVEAIGYNTTKDKTSFIWTELELCNYITDIDNATYDYKLTHVIIDDIMKNKYVQKQDSITLFDYMTNESYEKFSSPPFELIYRNETIDSNNETIHWIEIYEVNWTYIEKFYWRNLK
ncbi:MAG: hypothetical protein JSW62_02110 [Thermoplasmatales archaeon]|nr:MAG: hypothetical protein JSW62_02110 [Thermoplasmatales archaeon]